MGLRVVQVHVGEFHEKRVTTLRDRPLVMF